MAPITVSLYHACFAILHPTERQMLCCGEGEPILYSPLFTSSPTFLRPLSVARPGDGKRPRTPPHIDAPLTTSGKFGTASQKRETKKGREGHGEISFKLWPLLTFVISAQGLQIRSPRGCSCATIGGEEEQVRGEAIVLRLLEGRGCRHALHIDCGARSSLSDTESWRDLAPLCR